ncbi:MAG: hypothetical protein A07HR60_02083, partial [uncultured archaeon A07HR60]
MSVGSNKQLSKPHGLTLTVAHSRSPVHWSLPVASTAIPP